MLLDYAVSAFLTLFVVDPIGLTPTFLAGTALIGDWLLQTLQISLAAFRIAGGLLLFSIASEMVFGLRIQRESEAAEQAVEEHVRNIAAIPLMARVPARSPRQSCWRATHAAICF